MSVDASDNARGASSSVHNQDGDLVVVVKLPPREMLHCNVVNYTRFFQLKRKPKN